MISKFPKVEDNNIEEVIRSNKKLLIIFSSKDCGYCQLAKNNLLEIIDNFPELAIYECMISKAPKTIARYNISSVPILKLFSDGELVYTGFGVRNSNDLYYQLKSFFL
ncbi:thioredoxin family protein [Orenia marismortui]|uniref:Thioredoxin 1 n=1 Tax=Orenia marismortui TaxID=46469 RepID=A0A4R8GKJ9_9FIRM|nr:thioredoxin family protein [Orenia marismortui]TDX43614.1 thioredoxin 1 [Orenia marismortui]